LGFVIPPHVVPLEDDLDQVGRNLSFLFYGGAAYTSLLFLLVLIGRPYLSHRLNVTRVGLYSHSSKPLQIVCTKTEFYI